MKLTRIYTKYGGEEEEKKGERGRKGGRGEGGKEGQRRDAEPKLKPHMAPEEPHAAPAEPNQPRHPEEI